MTVHDVFISYAHVDNESLLNEQQGWVTVFQHALEKRLSQLLGRVAAVWWDKRRLTGNVYFDETIATACESSLVMVSVITPRYVKSDYCQREVEHFSARELKVGDRSRLFTCIKTPVARDQLFAQLEGTLGYEFFRSGTSDEYFREYNVYDPELKTLFMSQLEELAQDIANLIVELEPGAPTRRSSSLRFEQAKTLPIRRAPTVLIATTAGDVKTVRDMVVRELKAQELAVAPEASAWSEDAAGFDDELTQATAEVSLSVHILGGSYGAMPAGAVASYPALQLERVRLLAAQRPAYRPLVRIVWIARALEPTSAAQRALLAAVRADPTVGPLDELLEGSVEELNERIHTKLRALNALLEEPHERAPAPRNSMAAPRGRKVYVICCEREEEGRVIEVEEALGAQGFDVISSFELKEEETEAEREARHQHWLTQCHGCLILHGRSKVSWVRAQIDDVRKALGYRALGPMFGQVVYLAPPIDPLKRRYQVYFPKLEWIATPAQDLEPFVRDLQQETPAPSLRPAAELVVR